MYRFCLLAAAVLLLWGQCSVSGGRVFLLDFRNETGVSSERAEQACNAHAGHLASGAELRFAIQECSFSVCSRAWLSGPSIGTTVCRRVERAGLHAVDVQVEDAVEGGEEELRLGSFCITNDDVPCGDPPSFPHARLRGQTGLAVGDELLYECEAGFAAYSGDSAFSLLCDSCGEWYGFVPTCEKTGENATYASLDDTFAGGTRAPPVGGEEAEPTEGEESTGNVRMSVTDPPVALLSQKHLFWFPSEAFQDTEVQIKTPTDQIDIADKSAGSQSQPESNKDGHTLEKPTDVHQQNTDGSWLDGHPVSNEENTTVVGVSTEAESEDRKTDEERGEVGLTRQKDNSTPSVAVSNAPSPTLEHSTMVYTRSPTPENVSSSHEGMGPDLTTPSGVERPEMPLHPTKSTDLATPPDDIIILSTDIGSQTVNQNNYTQQGGGTELPCGVDTCSPTGGGPMVAIITVGVAVALAGLALGAWLYRKRQQKNLLYQLNDGGMTQQTQSIEMQFTD
ncbi:sushi domain-containing protein 5 [Denticeps clupeoides]|uniref:sushi domain-containing protein 5 n=1 Tax=Denticeps clupeoides TaxID=299321 RepID=UPI0010A55B2B|nr:sushi domain-containing protein 5 [Denticeps clupeoides]